MESTATETKRYTVEEYFELEKQSKEKLEFYNGKIEPMSGGTDIHNEIALKIGAALLYLLEDEGYKVYNSDMKIYIPSVGTFVYPDAVVVCRQPEFYQGRRDIITNPLLIVEVLSPSTQGHDRGPKFFDYRSIPTFKEYLLVGQDRPHIVSFYREQEHTWAEREAEGLEVSLLLKSVGCELPLGKVFKGVNFE